MRKCEIIFARALSSFFIICTILAACSPEPVYHPGTTRKILQVTGDTDTALRRPTLSKTETAAGLVGTDLGSSFEHDGKLWFLFGDSWGRPGDRDTMAYSTSLAPSSLTITVPVELDGKFRRIEIPGVDQAAYEVPSCGISVGGTMYIVHTTDWYEPAKNMERSVLARSRDNGMNWTWVYDLSAAFGHDMTNARFINAAMVEVYAADYPGQLPYTFGKVVLIWGSGAYRKSSPALACIPSDQIEVRSALRYFSGFGEDGTPSWSAHESDAADLFDHPQVGEFSTAWLPQIQRWVMLYNADSPRGITMRTALVPWGPYSPGRLILEPWEDGGYGRFLHVSWVEEGHLDAFHDPGHEDDWGGEYGPYIIPRFTTGDARGCEIYYILSTWNPYQTILVRSEIGQELLPGPSETTAEYLMPGDADWHKTSSDFYVEFTHHSVPYITTFNSEGDAATGLMWQWLPRDAQNARLAFEVHGGHAEVILIEGGTDIPTTGILDIWTAYENLKRGDYGDVVQCTWGHDDNGIDVPVDWSLSPFDSEALKVAIIDAQSDPWGFISVSRMTLHRYP